MRASTPGSGARALDDGKADVADARGRLAALEGIAATNTMVAFQQFSAHDLESMFGLGLEA